MYMLIFKQYSNDSIKLKDKKFTQINISLIVDGLVIRLSKKNLGSRS